jgi:hypothetical protein
VVDASSDFSLQPRKVHESREKLLQTPGARELWDLLTVRADPEFTAWANAKLNNPSVR